jgi:hypothetical protein
LGPERSAAGPAAARGRHDGYNLLVQTSEAGRNQAFNVVNGDIFRRRRLWPRLAADFGIEGAPYPGRPTPLEPQQADTGPTRAKIAAKYDLAEADLYKLASAWHTDLDLGREIEQPNDIAPAVVFLASADSAWTTGETLYISGGLR